MIMTFVVLFWTILSALVAIGNASAPIPISSTSQFKTIYIEDMTIRALVITVQFDQPILVNGIPITSRNHTVAPQQQDNPNNCQGGGGGGGGPSFPPISMQMDGKVHITCGSLSWHVDFQHDNHDGPPRSILTTVTTSDPGSSFMGFLSGFAMPESVNPNAISFVKLISGSQGGGPVQHLDGNTTESSIRTCGSKNITISAGIISNLAHEFYTPSSPIILSTPPQTPTCDFNSITSFKQAFDYVSNMAKRLTIDSSLYKQFSFLQGALDSRDALAACKSLVDPLFTTETVTRRLSPTRQCVFQSGTPEYQRSPCCNRNLQFSQCCAPTSPLTNITIVKNITTDRIRSQCSHPDKIILTLYSYIATANSVPIQVENQESLQERFGKFQDKCQTLVYGRRCTVDADCPYSQSCDTHQSQCKIPWGQDADLLLACYYDQFDPLLRSSLAGLWSLDETDRSGFINRMQSLILMDDCVGSNSWNLQTRCQSDDRGCQTCTYANQTTCLGPKSCNWNWQITDQHQCTAMNPVDGSDHFCGQCFGDGSSCWSQSTPNLCVRDLYMNEQSCRAANFTWYVGPWQGGTCVDPTKRSQADCLPAKACPILSPDGHNCESWSSHVCYAPNVTAQECAAASTVTQQLNGQSYHLEWQPWRNGGAGICAFNRQWGQSAEFSSQFCSSFSSAVANHTVLFFPGGYWAEGQFNDQTKCQTGRCNWQDPMQREPSSGLSPSQCQSKQMCSQPCPRCRSNQWIGPGLSNYCYSTGSNITTMDECSRRTGVWYANVVGANGRCLFRQEAATSSADACRAYGRSVGVQTSFASCDSLSMGTCSDRSASAVGELGDWLQCFWDTNAPCRTPDECARSGRCNDDDKMIWRGNGPSIPGSCYVDNVLNPNGWPGDCNSIRSPHTNQTLMGSRYPMKCVDQSALNATMCTAIGGQWKAKAQTRDECLSDRACYDEGSSWPNGKSPSECERCAGTMSPLYSWTPGQWVNATMEPLAWKAKQFASVNQWGRRVDGNAVWKSLVAPATNYYLGASVYGSLTAKYSLIADLFRLFSCDCTPGRDQRNCFGEVSASPIASAFLQKGKLNRIETPLGVIKAALASANNASRIGRRLLTTNNNGPVTITVAQVTAQSLAVLGPNNAPDYRVVHAASGVGQQVVGQLVGEGMQVSGFTPDISQVSVTLYESQQITPDRTTFPIPWIAYLIPNTTTVIPMRAILVQAGNGSITTGNITADGTYFPVALLANWTAIPTATPRTTSSSSALLRRTTTAKPTAGPLENNGSPAPSSASPASSAGPAPTTAKPNAPASAAPVVVPTMTWIVALVYLSVLVIL